MSKVYLRTYDLTKLALSFEKQHLDTICLEVLDPDEDPEYCGPASLWITGVNSSDPEDAVEDSVESDESLADLF